MKYSTNIESLSVKGNSVTKVAPSIGVAHFSAITIEPASFVSLAARAGFSRVGFRLFPAFAGAPFYALPSASAAARDVRLRLDGEGVQLFDIEFAVVDADFNPAALKSVLEDAAALGAKRLSCCGDDPDFGRMTANVAALCDLAGSVGMGVDVENMGWRQVRRFEDALALAKATGRDNCGALVDALHFYRNGGVPKMLANSINRVRSLQLCDVSGPGPDTDAGRIAEARGGRSAPGAGQLDLIGLVRATGPGVMVSVEVPIDTGTAPETHLKRLHASTRAVLDQAVA